MLVDQETQAGRDRKLVSVVLAGLMAIPAIGAIIAVVVLMFLATQVSSKSANRTKDFTFLAWAAFLYVFAMFSAFLGERTAMGIPLLYFIPTWLFLGVEIAMIVLGRGAVRAIGVVGLVVTLSNFVERYIVHGANGMIKMAALLFVISWWTLSRMKEFMFAR